MQDNRNTQQSNEGSQPDQRPLEKNETLQDAGASVPDYGRSEQNAARETDPSTPESNELRSGDQGTMGNP